LYISSPGLVTWLALLPSMLAAQTISSWQMYDQDGNIDHCSPYTAVYKITFNTPVNGSLLTFDSFTDSQATLTEVNTASPDIPDNYNHQASVAVHYITVTWVTPESARRFKVHYDDIEKGQSPGVTVVNGIVPSGTISSPQRCAGVTGTLVLAKDSYSRVERWEERINGTWTSISGTRDQVNLSTNSTNQHRVLLANDCGWSTYSGEGAVTTALPPLPEPSVGISGGDFCNDPNGNVVISAWATLPAYYPHHVISFRLYHPNGSLLETKWFEDHEPTSVNPYYNTAFSNVNGKGTGDYTVKIHVDSTSPYYTCQSTAMPVNYPDPPAIPVINSPITISHASLVSICNSETVTISTAWAEGTVTWYDMRNPTSPAVMTPNPGGLSVTIGENNRFTEEATETMNFKVVGRKYNECGIYTETPKSFSVKHSMKSVTISITGNQLCKDLNQALQRNLSASSGYNSVDYGWIVDGVTTSTTTAKYPIAALAPGAHTAQVFTTVYYSGECVNGISAASASPPNQHSFTVYGPLKAGSLVPKATICQGSNYTFDAPPATGGSPPYIYQWLKFEDGSWQTITTGGQDEDYTVNNIQFSYLKVKRRTTDGFCNKTKDTNPSELSVSPSTVAGSLSTTTPSFCSSGTAQLAINGAVGTITAWRVRSTNANGQWGVWTKFSNANQTSMTYAVSNSFTVNKTYRFEAKVKSGVCGQLTAEYADVLVYPASSYGTILASPAAVCTSGTAEVSLQGHAGTVNSWMYKTSDDSGVSWSPSTTITTADVPSVSLPVDSPADDIKRIYLFEVNVQSGTCANVTGTKVVSVDPVTEEGKIVSSVSAICESGHLDLTLQGSTGKVELWRVRSKISGEPEYSAWENITTANTLSVSHHVSNDTTKNVLYQFQAGVQSGVCAEKYTGATTVTVHPQTEGGVLASSKEDYGIVGDTLVLSDRVGAVVNWEKKTGSGPWSPISSTLASYTYSNITAPLTKYRVAVKSGSCDQVYSSEATITVYDEPSFPNISGNMPLPYGGSIEIETGNDYHTYQWVRGGIDLPGQTTYKLTVTQPGTYQVKVTGSATAPLFISGGVEVRHAIEAQLENINAISVTRFIAPGVTAATDLYALEPEDLMQLVSYLDGLGRPVQQVDIGGSPAKNDVVVPVQYDDKGRMANSYLPYAHTKKEGTYRPGALTGYNVGPAPTKVYTDSEQYGFYQNVADKKTAGDTAPYAVTVFDGSPLGRAVEQGAPGKDWQPGGTTPHTIRSAFRPNTTADNIKQFTEAGSGAAYPAGVLAVNETTDENGNKILSFTNGRGQTIAKKVQVANNTWLETCYVYDDWGNLRYQVPPKAMEKLHSGTAWSQAFADEWVFQYVYDTKHRLIEKKTPDAGWTYIAYDPLDRPVLVQDANLKSKNKWYFTKWDIKGRQLISGVYASTESRTTLQATLNSLGYLSGTQKWYEEQQEGMSHGYSNQAFPTSNTTIYQVLNYDHHDTDADGNPQYTYSAQGLTGESTAYDPDGQVTVVKRQIVGTSSWLTEYLFYDRQGRVIQTRGNNHLKLDEFNNLTTLVYSFDGRLLTQKRRHNTFGDSRLTYNTYEYDHAGRLTAVYQQNPGATTYQLLARYEYNELGELVEKNLHHDGAGYLQSVDYRYNIRGWLTSINNATLTNSGPNEGDPEVAEGDFFGMQLRYTATETGLVSSSFLEYNGNVAAVKWKNLGDGSGTEGMRGYLYQYDRSDRLTKGTSKKYVGGAWINVASFDETIAYDANGNINTMTRNKPSATGTSGTGMDNLTFTYAAGQGNRLSKVTNAISSGGGYTDGANAADEMTYDTAGNLNKDLNKGISSITYNDLNKPDEVVFADGRKIRYTYDGAGTKLTQTVYEDASTIETIIDYVDGFEYHDETLRYFAAPEGRVVHNGGVYDYEYAIADHQGNTRAVFTSKETTYTYMATFETAGSGLRQDTDLYLNVDPTKEVTMASYNNTPGGSKAVRMSSSYKAGPAFAVRVLPGDRVDAEVFGAFEGSTYNDRASLSTMITAVAGAFGGVSGAGGEQGALYNAFSEAMGVLGLAADAGSTVPNAYLNFVFMDELPGFDLAGQSDDGGFVLIPASAYQSEQKMTMEPFIAQKPGYLYIYLTFEENSSYFVYFDDFKVTYTPSKLIQTTDYYPFGASHSTSWTRETATPNPYLYNAGSELNEKTGWYETAFRGYDAYTGRFNGVDIMADSYSSLSSYHYSFNNPIRFNDPLGDSPRDQKRGNNWWTWRDKGPQDASSGAGQNSSGWNNATYGSSSAGGSAFPVYGPGDGGALTSFANYMAAGSQAAQFNRGMAGYVTIDHYLLGSNGTMMGNMWVFGVGASVGYESHSQGGFFTGVADGFSGGVSSTASFLGSLSSKEGWQAVGRGMMNMAMMANTMSPQGAVLRGQMAQSATNYVANIPNMSAYEVGYDIGFGAEKITETVLLSKGASLAGKVVKGVSGGAKGGSRAFFSGAGTEARAIEQGFQTLGQTRAGRNLAKMTEGMPYYGPMNGQPASQAWQWWARLSSTYAKGIPQGSSVNVFLNNPSPTGIWLNIEKPILKKRGINIIPR